MPIDPREPIFNEIVDAYVARFGRAETPAKMAHDLLAYERQLAQAELEIDRLKLDLVSAGYIRRDVSSHYKPGWKPKAPLADPVTDDWVATGREIEAA